MNLNKIKLSDPSDYAIVIKDKLLFGDIVFSKDIRSMRKMGIGAVVDLCHYHDDKTRVKYWHEMDVLYHPVKDSTTNNMDWAEKGSDFIEKEIAKGRLVYVHCYYGISRSTSQVLHYLLTRCKMKLKEAFEMLKEKRKQICPNFGFMKGLCEIEKKLYGVSTITPKKYAVDCICENFPTASHEEVLKCYDDIASRLGKDDDKFINEIKKKVDFNSIEPIGYVTIEALKERYQMHQRDGCVEHHPFE